MYADKHQSFYKLALSFLVKVARHVHSNQIRKLVIFLQYIKKKVSQLLLRCIVMQNILIFYMFLSLSLIRFFIVYINSAFYQCASFYHFVMQWFFIQNHKKYKSINECNMEKRKNEKTQINEEIIELYSY